MRNITPLAVAATAVLLSGCALRRPAATPPGECIVIVQNRTPAAIDVRMRVRYMHYSSIGALNPGEQLTHHVACAEQRVWVVGYEISWQVGAARRFGLVHGYADLVDGEKVRISLGWQ